MLKYFINCQISEEEMKECLNKFKDGQIIGSAIFEFHNNFEFRIYINDEFMFSLEIADKEN